ncbi:uncharacterized protein HMPREF1541_03347 [Cyphellophora europaea CBS 101466]|uniref:RING-type E3 ubiquitin transferase n=1 Tax=Cyphellophora europaea (strain CBS 101466) TaxID=1220924 RepID=W2RYA8_CYPE1|nr:uncharacterized protein HMPREF1541_03347 [Cyphellophora europaea CBS 101466]ETN41412.1 hypothetical protein HMPREF1541_03347 [Cyphellophora europaea CBS 101466]
MDLTPPPSRPPVSTSSHPSAIEIQSPEICVICLDLLSVASPADQDHSAARLTTSNGDTAKVATALPCQHSQFHYSCLGTWFSHSQTCPLCKTSVQCLTIHHDGSEAETITLPPSQPLPQRRPPPRRRFHPPTLFHPRSSGPAKPPTATELTLAFRRQLYARRIPSLYRGRGITRSGARKRPIRPNITPASFGPSAPDAQRLHRLATIWIRRELLLFPFLHPTSPEPSHPSSFTTTPTLPTGLGVTPRSHNDGGEYTRPPQRRTTAAHLLPFTLAVLQRIDLKGSAGQAVELLGEYLGRENAQLFCHELVGFLGSGARSVEEWDGEVMYWFDGEGEGEVRSGKGEVLGRLDDGDGGDEEGDEEEGEGPAVKR